MDQPIPICSNRALRGEPGTVSREFSEQLLTPFDVRSSKQGNKRSSRLYLGQLNTCNLEHRRHQINVTDEIVTNLTRFDATRPPDEIRDASPEFVSG